MKKWLGYVTALAIALTFFGCGDEKKPKAGGTQVTPAHYEVCSECGEVEGSTKCCVAGEGVKECTTCKRHKGSPGCCIQGHHVHLCKECGVAYEGDQQHTCDITKKCEKCGRQQGSPGCCLVVVMKKDAGK